MYLCHGKLAFEDQLLSVWCGRRDLCLLTDRKFPIRFMGHSLVQRACTHLGRLDHHSVPGGQAGCRLPGQHHQGIVPGDDNATDTANKSRGPLSLLRSQAAPERTCQLQPLSRDWLPLSKPGFPGKAMVLPRQPMPRMLQCRLAGMEVSV